MKQQAYGNYITFLNESILRAVTAIAFAEFNNEIENIQKYNQYEKNRGFYLQDLLTEELLNYRKNRNANPDFRVYLPTLLEKMNKGKYSIIANIENDR